MNRFVVLDGIRGVAALFVVTRHTEIFFGYSFFRSYLAVDLFFILSGFVIAYAYEEKLKNGIITLHKFIIIRLIRLYPIYFISLIFSALVLIHTLDLHHNFSTEKVINICYFMGMTALFLPTHMIGSLSLFPINGAYWSLLFELTSNILYAIFRPILSNNILFLIVIFSEIMIVLSAHHHGSLDIGFHWGAWSIFSGFFRSIFGVFIGILLYRYKDTIPNLHGRYKFFIPYISIFIIGLILLSPSAGKFNAIIDIFIVTGIFPFLVVLASQGENKKLEYTLLILGSASYAIYVLHAPVGQLISIILKDNIGSNAPISGIVLILFLITFYVFLEKQYDIPIRRYLSNSFIRIK